MFETIDNSSKLLRMNCQNTTKVVVLTSLEILSITSNSDSDIDKSESMLPIFFFVVLSILLLESH